MHLQMIQNTSLLAKRAKQEVLAASMLSTILTLPEPFPIFRQPANWNI